MEELCRKYHSVRFNRVQNSNLTFDFGNNSINGVLGIFFSIMIIIAVSKKNYKLLLFGIIVMIIFAIVKLQNKKPNLKTGFVSFKGNSIIITSLFGNKIIDCTKGIVIEIIRKQHFYVDFDAERTARMLNRIFDEKNVTYQLVVNYKDKNEVEQRIILASTNSDNSADEFEKFITNFYYEEEPKENNEKSEQNTIRFCM